MGHIFTFTGASGAGKTSLVEGIIAKTSAQLIVSTTTRAPRMTDALGEYEYVSREDFTLYKQSNAFLWSVNPFGDFYGTRKAVVDECLTKENSVGLMILVADSVEILRPYARSKITSFYLLSPEEKELRRRMKKRGDTNETIEKRMLAAQGQDISAIKNQKGLYDVFIQPHIGLIESINETLKIMQKIIGLHVKP